ncbi:MAG TPA: SCO family protein [Ktedonobacteraceae bacterium]|nr:SCO family protein [Ktedonobacteraceae bacterium]
MRHLDGLQKLGLVALIITSTLVIIVGTAWGIRFFSTSRGQTATQSTNPSNAVIGGFPMAGDLAPDFTLTDQFGHSVTLSSLRGREVALAFIDARCKTLCPLTANIMYAAKAQLGSSAGSQVELVAVNANPTATSVTEVEDWSIAHGMLHQWEFLTGTASQLESIYHLYNAYVQVSSNDLVEHDPITFIIDATGHERLYYETLDTNSKSDLSDEEIGLKDGMQQWLPKQA